MKFNTPDKHLLLSALEGAPIPIGIYEGPELRFVFINKAGAESIRKNREDVLGQRYEDVLPLAVERIAGLKRVYQTGEPLSVKAMEFKIGKADESNPIIEYVDFLSQAVRDENNQIVGVASFGLLVTNEVLAKKKLQESAHRTSQILDHLSTGFFSVDKNWVFNYANPASQSALGLPPSEVVGKNVWELHPQLVGSEFYHAYHKSMHERVVVEVVNYYPEQDKWYHTTSYPLDEGIAVSFTDITNRKKAEEARLLSDERFHTLTEAMPQLVWITDADGLATYFNRRWMERTGTSFEENTGLGWLNCVHPDDMAVAHLAWTSAQVTKTYDVEYRVKMADGSYRWHVARGVPTIGEDGKLKQWVGTTTDIQSQKQTQDELADIAGREAAAVKARDTFLSIASHELLTPVTSIKLQFQIVERFMERSGDSPVPHDRVKKLVSLGGRGLDRMTRLVNDMLDISRIQNGRLSMEFAKADILVVIRDIVERFSEQLQHANITASISASDEEFLLTIDRFRMEQVFSNLLTNAIRYASGSPLEILLEKNTTYVRIIFRDHGPGIAEKDQGRIFDRFERVVSASEVSGLGLGLYIVKEIIVGHGGTINVESSPGHGASFIINLPLNQ